MIYPVNNYVITQYFGETITDSKGHTGIDLYAPMGSLVYSCDGGEIICAGIINNSYGNTQYGNFILIDHKNGLYSAYAHLQEINVKVGMSVLQGAVIGKVGSTGNSTGPHLHFEIRGNDGKWNRNNFFDPMDYLLYNNIIEGKNNTELFEKFTKIKVDNSILNFRDKAGFNSNVITQLHKGTVLEIIGDKEEKNGITWFPVSLTGYVALNDGETKLISKLSTVDNNNK